MLPFPLSLIPHLDKFVAVHFGFSGRFGVLSQVVADKVAGHVK